MSEHERSPWAEPEAKKPLTLEEAYADNLRDDADIEDMRAIVSVDKEAAGQPETSTEVKVGDRFFVKRSSGTIEDAPVVENEDGELVLEVITADGQIGYRRLTSELKDPDTQGRLAAERVRQAMADEARDEIENMKFYPPNPPQPILPKATYVPSSAPDASAPAHEPYIPDTLDTPVQIRTIIAQPPQPSTPKKKKWWQ